MSKAAANPKVSVVITTHNRAALLPRAIRSVLAQTYESYELIVVDDCSTDDTPDVIRTFVDSRIRVVTVDTRGSRRATVWERRHQRRTAVAMHPTHPWMTPSIGGQSVDYQTLGRVWPFVPRKSWLYQCALPIGRCTPLSAIQTWLLRRLAYRMGKRSPSAHRVGIHTVFIGKENILFLKEWVLYHKYMGVEHFFLYDNSGELRILARTPWRPLFERNRMNKYGIPYDDIVALSEAEIADVLDHIRRRGSQRSYRPVAARRCRRPRQVRTGGGPERRSQAVRAGCGLDGLHGRGRVPGVGPSAT